jgi:hypothetical protein
MSFSILVPPHVGGVNSYVNVLRKELMKAGHQVDVQAHHPDMQKFYTVHSGKYLVKEKSKQVVYLNVLTYYKTNHPYVDQWENVQYSYELAAVSFNLNQYDSIHTQDIISTRALSRVKPRNVPLVATCWKRNICQQNNSAHQPTLPDHGGAIGSKSTPCLHCRQYSRNGYPQKNGIQFCQQKLR